MALVSILLSVVAFICTAIGFLTTPIPVVGTLFSFGAAALALGGIVLGGRAVTAAKKLGRPNDTARIAVVLNVLALVPALLVALTCGVCNALFSSGNVQLQRDFQFNLSPDWGPDGGVGPRALPPPARQPEPSSPAPEAPGEPGQAPAPGAPAGADRPDQQKAAEPAQRPSTTLPPPPLPAGPGK